MAVALAGTHADTVPSWVVLSFSMPSDTARPKIRTAASTKCMKDPATRTISRCQPGACRNDRGS
jgi:hypothetical protein